MVILNNLLLNFNINYSFLGIILNIFFLKKGVNFMVAFKSANDKKLESDIDKGRKL